MKEFLKRHIGTLLLLLIAVTISVGAVWAKYTQSVTVTDSLRLTVTAAESTENGTEPVTPDPDKQGDNAALPDASEGANTPNSESGSSGGNTAGDTTGNQTGDSQPGGTDQGAEGDPTTGDSGTPSLGVSDNADSAKTTPTTPSADPTDDDVPETALAA